MAASPSGTTITAASITDDFGSVWSISVPGAQVVQNTTVDTNTSNVQALQYQVTASGAHIIWHQNTGGQWWGLVLPVVAGKHVWLGGGNSPSLPQSASGTSISTGGALVANDGSVWDIGPAGNVRQNGVVDGYTANVGHMQFQMSGTTGYVLHENTAGQWYYVSLPQTAGNHIWTGPESSASVPAPPAPAPAPAPVPVPTPTPTSTTPRQKVLAFLQSILGKHTLSGQVLVPGQNDSQMWADINKLGIYPGLLGIDIYTNGNQFDTSLIQTGIDYYKSGGFVTMTCASPPAITGSVANWFTSGTSENNQLLKILGQIKSAIQQFIAGGMPCVPIRPWHEMNGGWTWYGQPNIGSVAVIELWQYTYNYMQTAGLGNEIVWIWSPNNGGGADFNVCYPGAQYTDVRGVDAYTSNMGGIASSYSELEADYGGLVCLGEFGPGGPVGAGDPSFSFPTLVNWIKSSAPNIVWWMDWDGGLTQSGGGWSILQTSDPVDALKDPWVLNRGEFTWPPSLLAMPVSF